MRDSKPAPAPHRPTRSVLVGALVALLVVATFGSVPVVSGSSVSPPNPSAVSTADSGLSDTTDATGDTVNASISPTSVVVDVGETVTITGDTTANEVRLYLIDPRGTFRDLNGTRDSMASTSVSGGSFEVEYDAFTRRGTYTLLVVSPWRDDEFVTTETLGRDELPPDKSHQQAVDAARAAYSGDEVLELTVTSMTPRFTLDTVANGSVTQGTSLSVSGTSNRADETTVTVDLLDETSLVVSSTTTTVDGETDRWSTTVATGDLSPGEYTVFATTNDSSAATTFVLTREEETTPAETPTTATPTSTPTATPTPTPAPSPTEAEPANATGDAGESDETDESLPGFGVGAALFALALVAAFARRRGR